MKATPMPTGGFEELALPVAVRKGLGIIAMKVFGQDQLIGRGTGREDALLFPFITRQPGQRGHAQA